jgi:hypothetical protein
MLCVSCSGTDAAVIPPVDTPEPQDGSWTVGEERQLGSYLTLLPPERYTWPNGVALPLELLTVINKLEQGESLTEYEEVVFLAIDHKLRYWQAIEDLGKQQ